MESIEGKIIEVRNNQNNGIDIKVKTKEGEEKIELPVGEKNVLNIIIYNAALLNEEIEYNKKYLEQDGIVGLCNIKIKSGKLKGMNFSYMVR